MPQTQDIRLMPAEEQAAAARRRNSMLTWNHRIQTRPYNQAGYMSNGAPAVPPGAAPLLPNQGRIIQTGPLRVLCIADVRG